MEIVGTEFRVSATDLSNHLSCAHLTQLNLKVALGELTRPFRNDPSLEVLIKRGREHEAVFVHHLKAKNLTSIDLRNQSPDETLDAMARGIDVIVQAPLKNGQWQGYADVLIKTQGSSCFGDWIYEVYDTKLAQTTRASTVLQLCLYTDLLSSMQKSTPEKMYVVKPFNDFTPEAFSYNDFQSYYKLAKREFESVIRRQAVPTYPAPTEHCGVCAWWSTCDKHRHEDDYLSLVAGIQTLQIEELIKQDIKTLTSFATVEELRKPDRGNRDALLRRQAQARIQLKGKNTGKLIHEVLPFEQGRGLNRLPEPNIGDIYFDLEGDAFYPGGSIEYMFGYAFRDTDGSLKYKNIVASNRVEEKQAFESFMQFVMARWRSYPNLHIYHFGHYESTAVKRMASLHSLFEQEVDELLRSGKFVDLHGIFKEAFLASVERYSLKDLEGFARYTRQVELHDASVARKNLECALELNEFTQLPKETIDVVSSYNKDDCFATEALHSWLEERRAKLVDSGMDLQRPTQQSPEPNEKLKNNEIRARSLFESLIYQLPEDRAVWKDEHYAQWLLAHQVDYFRREDKTSWWEHFRLHKMEVEDLIDERKAIVGLEWIETLPLKGKRKNEVPTQRFKYPPQEIGVSVGDKLFVVNSQNSDNKFGIELGTVEAIALEDFTIDIKKKGTTIDLKPHAVHVYDRVDPGTLWTSIMNLAQVIDEEGFDHASSFPASKDLLMKRKPRLIDGREGVQLENGENPGDAAIRLVLQLDKSILPIQGPPGTGKTHTGARMILELVKAKKKVGVTAISHRVITTLVEKVHELNRDLGIDIHYAHKVSDTLEYIPVWVSQYKKTEQILDAIANGSVVGGTAWLWADDRLTNTLDYLFIDEAGQMSLTQALAASRAARNIVLLGDPQQLEQPTRGAHPEGSDVAALTYLLEGSPTMPIEKGLFLDVTRRMHPKICDFTSELFYEKKLTALPTLEQQMISGGTRFDGAGLIYVPIEHTGSQNSSREEVVAIANIINDLIRSGYYPDDQGKRRRLIKSDILVVAPYNAQVALLKESIKDVEIGTVDKFQGKEAPVVIYSMTSSSVQDAPRGMDFLFNLNRLNVATSRAKSICILVASPMLIEPECRTVDQMKKANALCRFVEMATIVDEPM